MKGFETTSVVDRLDVKVSRMLDQFVPGQSPHGTDSSGRYDNLAPEVWTSGFWPGILWIMYELTGKERYKQEAWDWDRRIEQPLIELSEHMHHDVGFQFLNTAVVKHAITGDPEARRRGIAAANYLAGRYNPAGEFIRAWNWDAYGWAIIDCMMNLSLLFWASEETKDPRYKHIAVKHANTAMKYFVREDGSVNHIVCFDPETGEFKEALGGQGYAPDSAWSRGASWAIYGFANTYRNTGDVRYLQTAKRAAHYFLASLPADHVPYWDFRLPSLEGEPRDSSAAAITASGLIELAGLVPGAEGKLYRSKAEAIVSSLTESYSAWDQHDYQGIITGGTGNKPKNHFDTSLIFGDYYYVEAVAKLHGWQRKIY